MIISAPLLNALLQLVILLPFIFIGKRFSKQDLRAIAVFYIFYMLWALLSAGLSGIQLFAGQQWNWTGKLAGFLAAAFFIYRNKLINNRETGWTLKFNQGSVYPVLGLSLCVLILRLFVYLVLQTPTLHFSTETILFQGVLLPTGDEMVFRGILLALLNRIYLSKEDIGGFSLSRGVLITSLLFGLSQGFLLQNGLHLQINLIRILLGFFMGIIAALLKERSGSLLPAILFHALWNLIGNHL